MMMKNRMKMMQKHRHFFHFHLLDCDGDLKRRFKTSKDQATDDGVTEETAPGTSPAL